MAIEIEVLYSDLTRKKQSLDDIDKLPKDNVLFILVTTTEEIGKLKNIVAGFEKDNYALCRKRSEGHEWVMLYGWDDDEFVWRKLQNPHGDCNAQQVVDAPLGFMHVIFRGVHVEASMWTKAKEIFNKEMA